jgi:hypothetical protein
LTQVDLPLTQVQLASSRLEFAEPMRKLDLRRFQLPPRRGELTLRLFELAEAPRKFISSLRKLDLRQRKLESSLRQRRV